MSEVSNLLLLLEWSARPLGYARKHEPGYPLVAFQQKYTHAWGNKIGHEVNNLNNVLGILAVTFYHLYHHDDLGEKLEILRAIRSRKKTTDEEVRSEQAIYRSMLDEPESWLVLFQKYEKEINLSDFCAKKQEINDMITLPKKKELNYFFTTLPLKRELQSYADKREKSIFDKYCFWSTYDKKTKVSAARSLIAILGGEDKVFSQLEYSALQNGTLGDIVAKYRDILTDNSLHNWQRIKLQ